MNNNQKSSNQAASYFAQAVLGSQQLQLANNKNSKSLQQLQLTMAQQQ